MNVTLLGTVLHDWEFEGRYSYAIGLLAAAVSAKLPTLKFTLKSVPLDRASPVLPDTLADEILAEDPEVVGLSGYCWDYAGYRTLIPELKRRAPQVKVVLGGPLATLFGFEMMQELESLDVAVHGEGETTFTELLQGRFTRLEGVRGITYRDGNGLQRTAPRPVAASLGEIPSSYLTGFARPTGTHLFVESARGCRFRCLYCISATIGGGRKPRRRPHELLAQELAWARENGYREVSLIEPALNFDERHLQQRCQLIHALDPEGALKISYDLHHWLFRPDHLATLQPIQNNTGMIGIALESTNPAALKANGRPALDRDHFALVVRELSRIIPVNINVMIGLVGDTLQGFKETIEYLCSLAERPGRRSINVITAMAMIAPHGSHFHQQRERYKLRISAGAIPYIESSASFPAEDMLRAMEYLHRHPMREIINVVPQQWPGLVVEPGKTAAGGGAGRYAAHPVQESPEWNDALAEEEIDRYCRLLGRARLGQEIHAGWTLDRVRKYDGNPVFVFRKDPEELWLQITKKNPSRQAYISTVLYDLSYLLQGGEDPDGEVLDLGKQSLMDHLTQRVTRAEKPLVKRLKSTR